MKSKNNVKISYEREADVLSWEISKKPIDFAREIGNIVVHFTKDGLPVLVEILEASKFLSQAKDIVKGDHKASLKSAALATR